MSLACHAAVCAPFGRSRLMGSLVCARYVERFCVQTNTWESCEHMLVQRGSHGCAALNGRVYVVIPNPC